MHTYFITGTDTDIGKTAITCSLIAKLTEEGFRVGGMKPVAAGCHMEDGFMISDDVKKIIEVSNVDLNINENGKNYRILGFIDKLFLFKKEGRILIRDFKTSKGVFEGKEAVDNMQDLMYSLAVKYLYPEYIKRNSEFLFIKFDCRGKGHLKMDQLLIGQITGSWLCSKHEDDFEIRDSGQCFRIVRSKYVHQREQIAQ